MDMNSSYMNSKYYKMNNYNEEISNFKNINEIRIQNFAKAQNLAIIKNEKSQQEITKIFVYLFLLGIFMFLFLFSFSMAEFIIKVVICCLSIVLIDILFFSKGKDFIKALKNNNYIVYKTHCVNKESNHINTHTYLQRQVLSNKNTLHNINDFRLYYVFGKTICVQHTNHPVYNNVKIGQPIFVFVFGENYKQQKVLTQYELATIFKKFCKGNIDCSVLM